MTTDFIAAIRAALARNAPLDEIVELLREHKAAGLSQHDAYAALQSMRGGADEGTEDRILEIMDFVSGWCQPAWRVWD